MLYTEAFAVIAALAEALDVRAINQLPGCWEHQVDDRWWIAVNGHAEQTSCSHGAAVPAYGAYVEFNEWPAAVFTPVGGEFVAGTAANEEAFIAAVKAATERARG
jgi:hypothetical protein